MSALNLMTARPWAMTEDALRQMMAIANREQSDPALAAELRAARASRPDAVALRAGRSLDGAEQAVVRDGVAILSIEGPIFRYANLFTQMSGATSLETLARDFQTALDNPSVQAILFSIDSPGGDATGINEFAEVIVAARSQKPIGAYVGGLGASAAYWLAAAAEVFTIDATAAIGSIGVVLAVPDPSKTKSASIEIVSSRAPNKRPDVATEAGRNQYQSLVDAIETVFVESVARNRNTTPDAVLADFGQGGLLVGREAIAASMADSTSSFEATITQLKTMAATRKRPMPGMRAQGDDMDWKAFFGGLFGAAAEQERVAVAPTGGTFTLTTDDPATGQAVTTEALPATASATDAQTALAEALTKLQRAQSAATATQAQAWADKMITEGRALPTEATTLMGMYSQLAADDAQDQGGRVASLEALIGARPAHTLTKELVEAPQTAADTSKDRTAELLKLTALGRAAIAK